MKLKADINVFFDKGKKNQTLAKAYCEHCPVRWECLESAVTTEQASTYDRHYGIYGGLTPSERKGLV